MNYTIDTLWVLLEHLIDDIQNHCIDYDSQITFTRKKLPHYIHFRVHYTAHFSPQFIIKTIDDLYELATHLELSLLWHKTMAQNVFTYVYEGSFIDQRILQLANENTWTVCSTDRSN